MIAAASVTVWLSKYLVTAKVVVEAVVGQDDDKNPKFLYLVVVIKNTSHRHIMKKLSQLADY